jgi:hypothetical protein
VNGPFERLDIEGIDDALVCVDGVCAVPGSGEGFVQEGSGVVLEGDAGGEGERLA